MAEESTATVAISDSLRRRVEDRLDVSEFDTVDEYVSFVLEETLSNVEEADEAADTATDEEVRDRLRSLGYIDE